jgi:hypothetical protein
MRTPQVRVTSARVSNLRNKLKTVKLKTGHSKLATIFKVQLTAVSVVFVTFAVNVAWLPSTTDPLAGFTVTTIDGGGGGGGGGLPEPQPSVQAPSARSAVNTIVLVLNLFP